MGVQVTSVDLAEVNARLAEIVEQVRATGEPVVVTRDGQPVAEIRPPREAPAESEDPEVQGSWLEGWYGALADDEEFLADMAEIVASRQHDRPRPLPWEDSSE